MIGVLTEIIYLDADPNNEDVPGNGEDEEDDIHNDAPK